MIYLRAILLLALWIMSAAIFVSVIVSWLRAAGVRVPYRNPLLRFVDALADVMLRPIRNAFQTMAGGLDFSPIVAIIILQILGRVILRLTG